MSYWLGIDFGEKRVGVALADDTTRVATPFETLRFRGRSQLLSELQKIVSEYGVSRIVVGLPLNLKGEKGPAAEKVFGHVEWFKKQLAAEWFFWDERMSTKEVERLMIDSGVGPGKRKAVRDGLAAQRILQSYLDANQRER